MFDSDDDNKYTPEDLAANRGFLGLLASFGLVRTLRYLPKILLPEESILGLTRGLIKIRPWLLVITDLRVIFLGTGLFYGIKLLDIPLSHIRLVFHRLGLFWGEIIFDCGETRTRIGYIRKKNMPGLMAILSEAMNGSAGQAAAQPQAATDRLAQLERLTVLKAKGTLTDSEFMAQKRKILSGR
ncbi:MAG: PH domain-containing protein [Deltaproteobacteria bacterium]|jgi:hypothetical protein|nr:PH domain-containing protein [Deltaproteobacteria bacterium]